LIGYAYNYDLNTQMESGIAAPIILCIGGRLADDSRAFFESWTTGSIHRTTLTIMEFMQMDLKESQTLQNLQDAFAGESQANRRYLYFAAKADVEGENDVAAVFRSTAEGETGHAHGHLEYMEAVGDPATGLPMGNTADNLRASVAGETHEYSDMYPGMAKTARDEGFDEIADWFETLAKAERSHANRFQKALDAMG
jgi:rubrerythrin